MSMPVVFMAFANNAEQPLPGLERESDQISRTLTEGVKKQCFQLQVEAFATVDKIAHYLIEYKDQVIIFHYGGHADSAELFLSDEKVDSQGIAQLLKTQKNLQVVFLNGCSTRKQVEYLHELGIRAVIATSNPIDDDKATLFADKFYFALARDHSVQEAFEMAAGAVKAKGVEATLHRGLQFREDTVEMPWGMYTSADEVLSWKLPKESANQKQIIIRRAGDQFNFSKSPVNQQLTDNLLEALRPFSRKIEFLFMSKEDGEEIDERLLNREIIDSLPAPIGEQIRKLFSLDAQSDELDKIGLPRLKQLVHTYETLLEFFSSLLLAELWDAHTKNNDLLLSDTALEQIRQLITQENSDQTNLFEWCQKVLGGMHETKLLGDKELIFLEELSDLFEAFQNKEEFQVAGTFMEEMRREIHAGKVEAEEVESFCVQSEEKLSKLFREFAFCARYKLNSIKRIVIEKTRNRAARFSHYKVKLDTITAGYKDTVKDYAEGYTEDKSIILLKSEKEFGPYLNLSPFLIDENALRGEEKSKLFFYNGFNAEKKAVHYRYSNVRKDQLVITDQYPLLREELDDFCTSFFGKTLDQL